MKLSPKELRTRAEEGRAMLASCVLCGHRCQADRAAGRPGKCGCGMQARVASALLHTGEEPALGPKAGTVFFSNCNLTCVYCQNWQISQDGDGEPVGAEKLADKMLDLQARGAANVELVSPTPWVPQIIDALAVATERGLRLPVVYNTGGYDSPEALRLLDGVVDVYLPDMRYSWRTAGERFSGAADYPEVNCAAVLEMYRQVGDVVFNERDQAQSGLIIRLLVLPNDLAGIRDTLAWMARHLSTTTWFSLMAQYAPAYRAGQFVELDRVIGEQEYRELINFADRLGFENFYTQSPVSQRKLRPDFAKPDPFGG